MPTLDSILNTAASGLRTQQAALDVTSHNIANASTPGYSRQRAVIAASTPLNTPNGVYGTGAQVVNVTQARDALLDADYRLQSALSSQQQTRSDMLGQVQSALNEPTDKGLQSTLDQFFNAWSDLATNPMSPASRSVVRQQGIELVNQLHQLANSFDQVRQQGEEQLTGDVARVNELTGQVANLNRQIVSVEADGTTASDLRDQRNQALDELSTLLPIQAHERADGSVGIAASGFNIVDGARSTDLETTVSGGTYGLKLVDRTGTLPDMGGSIGGTLQVLNTDLPSLQSKLDDLTSSIVSAVNTLHETGTNPDGATGVDFFDPTGVTASTIELSDAVSTSANAIAAGTGDVANGGAYRSGANDVAQGIAAIRDTQLGALADTPGDYFAGLVSSVGMAVRSSTDAADVHQTLASQADTRRMSLSGVSTDEELVKMIQFQSAYQAAARVLTTVDKMYESLLSV